MKKSTKAWSMKMRLALLALAALVWIAVPVSARAEGETVDTWDGTAIADGFAAGEGTQDNPFQIETAAELAYFAKNVNAGNWYDGEYIVLKNDLDLNNQEWTPIGNARKPFKGNFDGNNHTVTGMKISGALDCVGLFGGCTRHNVYSAIKNITVKNSDIHGEKFVGAIVGRAEEINIENCRSIGNTINGETDVGGICGKIGGYSGGKVSQCYNSSKVTGGGRVGGIAGMGSIAENCLNTGEITIIREAYRSACGGIFGIFGDATTSARVTACVNLGKVSGGESFGGIVGKTETSSTGHISNCYYNMDAITGGFDAGTALTAGQLCGALPDGLDSTIWKEGSVDTSTAKATQGRFGTATGTYINLTKVADIKETKTAPVPVYNYVTTNGDDWDIYTLITTAEEFAAIGQVRDEAKWSANYVLGNDIDVSGVQLSSIGDPGTPYTGKFSGDGHTISHVDMTKENDVYSSGLFAQIGYTQNQLSESGKVMLLAANGVIASNTEAGGICESLSVGEIYGCSFTGTVKGYTAGGICGNVGQYTKISQCFFAGDVQGKDSAAGICGYSPFKVIDHCISIAAVTSDEDCAGIVNSGDYGTTNCYFNNDVYDVKEEEEGKRGRSTLQLTSPDFFEKLIKDEDFNPDIWTKKANDKENGIAYYPSLGENNAVGVNYTTGLQFERADTNTPTYGQDITFNAKALVNFVTDEQLISAEDTDGSLDTDIKLCAAIRKEDPFVPLIIQSSESENALYASKYGAAFIDKNSKKMDVDLRRIVSDNFGFGDFIFRNPDTLEEIARVKNLKELQNILFAVPAESFLYHISRNHVSRWLYSRAMFPVAEFLKPITWNSLQDVDAHRKIIFEAIVKYRKMKNQGVVAVFKRDRFDRYSNFARIGDGSLGGKGRGLAFIDNMVKHHPEFEEFDNARVAIPKTVVLCTDVFDEFMETNNLYQVALSDAEDDVIQIGRASCRERV